MLCLKYESSEIENRLQERMKEWAEKRKRLYEILNKDLAALPDDDHNYLVNPANQYLRGYRILTEKGIVFFEKYLKGRESPRSQTDALAELIRPKYEDGKFEPEPIIINAHDFVEKTEQKFRAGNRFVYYAAKYLIDHELVKDWYWEAEKFMPEKVKEFQKGIKEGEDWRLCIENDHVTIGIPKAQSGDETISNPKERHKAFYQFSLGPRALRYLLAFEILKKEAKNEKANINDFLAVALKQDLNILCESPFGGERDFVIMEDQFLPGYLKETDGGDIKKQMDRITQRFDYIKKEWAKALDQKQFLKRAEKNQIVMDCYRFFDWTAGGKEVKFLRKNEYKQMSVCHYSLKEQDKFHYLYEELFALNKRKPSIPKEVKDLLYAAESLDKLMETVIGNRKRLLENEIEFIEILPKTHKKEKGERIIALSKVFGLPVPDSLQTEEAQKELKAKRLKTLDVLPFPISPVMVLKYFGHESYKDDYVNTKGASRQANDIFKKLRNGQYTAGLHKEHYDTNFVEHLVVAKADEAVMAAYKKQQHKWIGAINTTHTEDAVLWQVALKYLENNAHTAEMALAIKKNRKESKVGNLNDAEIKIDLKKGRFDAVPKDIWISLRMHQLDDVMFATDYDSLRRAAEHYLHRHGNKDELLHWNNTPIYAENLDEKGKLYDYHKSSGDPQNPIPYHTLRTEMQLIAQHGIYLAAYLLDWERNVLREKTKGMNAKQQHALLKQNTSKKADDIYDYADFDVVVELSSHLNKDTHLNIEPSEIEKITKYRNSTFHNGIPVTGSYTWWARPGSNIGEMLKIAEPLHWPKDRSGYKKGAE
jgi:hypothetical protein